MNLSNENTLSANTNIKAEQTAENAASPKEKTVSVKKKFDWFGMTARAGEQLFDALKTVAKYVAYGFLWLVATFLRGWSRVAKVLRKVFARFVEFIKMPFRRYKRALKMDYAEISDARREKGVLGGAAAGAKVTGRILFGKRGVIVSVVNWVLPIVSCIFLFNIISYANSQTYALKLTVNGDFVGYINDETIFTDAEKMAQKRINYTGSNTELIVFEPSYEVQSIGYNSTLNIYQTADKILELMGGDIKTGYGLYIGDVYFGTLEEHSEVDRVLEELLDQCRTENPTEVVEFEEVITFIEGKYLADSFVDEDEMIFTLTSSKQVRTYHTVLTSGSPSNISKEIGMSVEELDRLNPGFNEKATIYSGERVNIIRDVPFLSIRITREEHYSEVVPYETQVVDDPDVFVGDQLIGQTGKDGEAAIVANVSYVNGIEVSRNVISTTITTQPVTQIMLVGTTPRPADAGPATIIPEGQFYWPVGGYDGGHITWPFGGGGIHAGLDIQAAYATPIYAAASGTVINFANDGEYHGGSGNFVKIRLDNGLVTCYYHMSGVSSSIYIGKRVTMAELIGYMGNSGYVLGATGIHLHFEVQYNGVPQDPMKYLPAHK